MFLGHIAVGLAAKRAAPKTSLGLLLGASELIDLLFPVFVLTGWEQVRIAPSDNPFLAPDFYYPLSHSLVMTLVWGAVAAFLYWMISRSGKGAVVIGFVVTSHWVLDAISHKPDVPLYPGASPMIGLGLWYSVAGTIIVELLMLAAGIWAYTAITRPKDRIGTYGFWSFLALMLLLYASLVLGPPAPDTRAFAWVGISFSLFFVYAAWFDRHREVIPSRAR